MTRHAGGRRRSRGYAQDRSRAAHVGVHAGFGDSEEARDLFGRETAGDGAENLTLPVGQRVDRLDAPSKHAPGEQIPGYDPKECGSRALHPRCKRPRLATWISSRASAFAVRWLGRPRARNAPGRAAHRNAGRAAGHHRSRQASRGRERCRTRHVVVRPSAGARSLVRAPRPDRGRRNSSRAQLEGPFGAKPPGITTVKTDPLFQYVRSASLVSVSLDTQRQAEGFCLSAFFLEGL